MDLKQLRYFIGICDAGSISRAAKVLYVAQPALSNHVSNMEASLGVELLHRSSHGVVPTESGEILYAAAQRIMRDVSRISEEVKTLQQNPAGKVAIGVAEAQSNIFGDVFLHRMVTLFPSIELHYTSGQSIDLYRKLQAGLLDIGLFFKEAEIAGVDSRIILNEELFIASAYQKDTGKHHNNVVTLEELRTLPFIFPYKTHFSIRRIVESAFNGVDFSPQVVAEMDSFISIKKYVSRGLASTILPWSALHEEVENKTIMLRTIEGVKLNRNIELCLPVDRPQSIAVRETSRVANEVIKELISSGKWLHASFIEEPA
ncbi:MAG: LysR substrate-binding domain-containing protein [Halioglobus sp.]